MTCHQQQAAENHRLAHPQVAIGQQAADDRHGVDQRGIAAQDLEAIGIGEQVVLGKVQKQQVLHAIEREALPQFGGKTDKEAPGAGSAVAVVINW